MAGLYIHIPFCKQACHYCDFHFSTSLEDRASLIDALCQEMALQKDYLGGDRIETIYFGGGTPSLLSEKELQLLIDASRKSLLTEGAEITLEANPDDLSGEKLGALKQMGIHRLSIGIQSFDDATLKFLNRAHASSQALQCFDHARDAGFSNISIDLIYAIPGQDNAAWKKNIEQAIQMSPEHISAYSLTIEDRTVFGTRQKKGQFRGESDDVAAAQMEMLMTMLEAAGYEQYEISNFCKPGFISKHNSGYWNEQKYLGIGPSAHSYDLESRQYTASNNSLYLRSLHQNKIPFEKEVLTPENKINEYLFTRLRTIWGCDLDYLQSRFHFDLVAANQQKISEFLQYELVQINNNLLLLTEKGKLLADKISSDLFVLV